MEVATSWAMGPTDPGQGTVAKSVAIWLFAAAAFCAAHAVLLVRGESGLVR
jgi:hypothetical protein